MRSIPVRSGLPILLLALLLAPGLHGQVGPEPRPLAELENLFRRSCAGCHGADGSARSPQGLRLKGRDFTSAKAMRGRTDRDLEATIRRGLAAGLRMPAFRAELSAEEIHLVVREIVRKAKKGKPIGNPPTAR